MTSNPVSECFVYIILPGAVSAITDARFLVEKEEAEAIAQEMTSGTRKWYDVVRSCGVSEQDAETIRGAFLYPGFFY